MPSVEQRTVDALTTNFIQELVTEKGSNVFDKNYGTTFISDIGDQVNFYKVEYLVNNTLEDIKNKYSIVNLEVSNATFNKSNGFLEIHLRIEFEDVAVEKFFNFVYGGIFTDKMILEID
jgi:hypothetical protein